MKPLRSAGEANSLAAAIGISAAATVLALLASVYWVPTGWRWSLVFPALIVLSTGPANWWLRGRRNASRSH